MAMAAVVGLGAVSAISSIAAGNAQAKDIKRQGEYNAQVLEQQSQMVAEQAKLKDAQDTRNMARVRSTEIARTGKNGLMLSGSPLAVMVDNETQMQLDKNVNQYNYTVQQNYLQSGANSYRYQAGQNAKLAKMQGYSNAFSTMLKTAFAASGPSSSSPMTSGGGGLASNAGQAYSSYTYMGP